MEILKRVVISFILTIAFLLSSAVLFEDTRNDPAFIHGRTMFMMMTLGHLPLVWSKYRQNVLVSMLIFCVTVSAVAIFYFLLNEVWQSFTRTALAWPRQKDAFFVMIFTYLSTSLIFFPCVIVYIWIRYLARRSDRLDR